MSPLELALRAVLLRARTAAVATVPLLLGALAVLLTLVVDVREARESVEVLGGQLLVGLVVALVALVLGTTAFGDERESGTLPLLLSTATSRRRLVAARVVAVWVSTVLVCLPALAGLVVLVADARTDAVGVVTGLAAGVVAGAAAYAALFVLLSLVTRRALLVGLAYVAVWEGSLATFATAVRNLSVGAYARSVVGGAYDDPSFSTADVGPAVAAVVLLGVAAVATAASVTALRRVDAAGPGD